MTGESARRIWQEKLEFLREREAITSDPAMKFSVQMEIKEALGKLHELQEESGRNEAAPRVSPTRLRHGAEHLFGRDEELALLDAAWADSKIHIQTIVAWGGVGKTSLVATWASKLAACDYEGARYFDWSFYSQGTREQGGASAEIFIAAALEFFGDADMAHSAASPWDKGARLAHLVAQERTLLILDGLEPLQYPPGPMAGKLKDPAVQTLLKGLAQRNPGLCIVTTREPVQDLATFRETTAPQLDLEHLPIPAGVELLKAVGVRGTDSELRQLVEDVGGHALTLNLIGRFLVKAHGGDIRRRDRVRIDKADANIQGGHAFRAMAAYETWLGEGGQDGTRSLAILRLLGLFDRPAGADCLAALRREPAIAGLTEPLVGLAEEDWNLALSWLADCGLISAPAESTWRPDAKGHVDAHPLIRAYFAKQLHDEKLDAWREAHKRLYEHLKDSTEDKPQATLEDIQPLYQAVAHGCHAGLYQKAFDDIYWSRILRGDKFYSTRDLGAFGADLGAVACFFEHLWTHLAPSLSVSNQSWLLSVAGFCLRALGRVAEALDPMRAGVDAAVAPKDWRNAAISTRNLSQLELALGDFADALRDAQQSLEYADRSTDAFERVAERTTLADALHQGGQQAMALQWFREAEAMQAEEQPEYPLLYSLRGFHYCDLLLGQPEWLVWCRGSTRTPASVLPDAATVPTRCHEVEDRAARTLGWAETYMGLLDVGLGHLTLGRAALYRAILTDSQSQRAEALQSACQQINAAVDGLHRASDMTYLPHGLLSRAWLRAIQGDRDGAWADLDEAWEIAECGPMRLHMADIYLYRARLFHDGPDRDRAIKDLTEARKLIEQCGYHRRDEELADAEAALGVAPPS